MKPESHNQYLTAYLEDFRERVLQPKYKRLKYIVESRNKQSDQNEKSQHEGERKEFVKPAKESADKDKRIDKLLKEVEVGGVAKYITSSKDTCPRLKEEILREGNTFQGKPVIEFSPLFRHVLSTEDPKTLKELPKIEQLLDGQKNRELARNMGWADEGPFHPTVGASHGDENEVSVYVGYDFMPMQSSYRYFIKMDGLGIYAAVAEPVYGSFNRVRLQLKLNTLFIQYPYQGVVYRQSRPWTLLDIDSYNIYESDYLGGFEFFETDVTLLPRVPVMIIQHLQLYAHGFNDGFGYLGFNNGSMEPYMWVNFGMFGVQN